jgi:hypothetical protein
MRDAARPGVVAQLGGLRRPTQARLEDEPAQAAAAARPHAAERGAGALGDLCAGKAALLSCDASTRTTPREAAPS